MQTEIIGCVLDTKVYFNDSGTSVLIVETEQGEMVQLKGRTNGDEEIGITYRFGIWDTKTYRGEVQYLFRSWCIHEPNNPDAIKRYLCRAGKGHGLGERTAHKIVNDLKYTTLEKLRENPYLILHYNDRMQEKHCEAIGEKLRGWYRYESTTLELDSILSPFRVRKDLPQQLIKDFGVEAPSVIQRNPYSLLKYSGVGFGKADAMWISFGLPLDKLKRQTLAAVYGLESRGNGSIWFPASDVARIITDHVGQANIDVLKAFKLGKRSGLLKFKRDGEGDQNLYVALGYVARAEERFVKDCARVCSHNSYWPDASSDDFYVLSDHQRKIYRNATYNQSLAILGGGPGTGKTFTAAQIILNCIQQYGEDAIAVCAPTGKAALRLSEALRDYGAKIRVKTIHSLLRVQGTPGAGFTFDHTELNPLKQKFFFIDEFSMPDILIASALFRAIPAKANVLCIGDINQLPPVGPGAPLRDMRSHVSNAILTETRRNSGRIVSVCENIRDEVQVEFSQEFDNEGENCKLIELKNNEDIIAKLFQGMEMARSNNLDPMWDVQTLVAVNEKGDLSRKALNKQLQNVLNPKGYAPKGSPFRLGDKVVRLSNALLYAKDENGTQVQTHICNGDLAEVTSVSNSMIKFTCKNPTRIINSSFKNASEGWDLGYALSCHKSQGSEWPIVFILLDGSGPALRVASREWIYTAISRGKTRTILLGKRSTFEHMRLNQVIMKRKTFTKEMLDDFFQTNVDSNVTRTASQTSERSMCKTH